MKIYIIFFFLITSACSQYSTSSNQPINFKYSKEIISNLDSLEPKFLIIYLIHNEIEKKKYFQIHGYLLLKLTKNLIMK